MLGDVDDGVFGGDGDGDGGGGGGGGGGWRRWVGEGGNLGPPSA